MSATLSGLYPAIVRKGRAKGVSHVLKYLQYRAADLTFQQAGRLQPHQQILPPVPPGKIPHHVHAGGRHPQQEEGNILELHAQEEGHPDCQKNEALVQ